MTDLEKLTDRLRTAIFKNRIRINEFFRDYDPLRSGFVTHNQFQRCMDVLRLSLSTEEFELLILVYGDESRGPKMVDYVSFSESIEKAFTESNLESEPLKKLYDIRPKLLETLKPNVDLTATEFQELKEILEAFKDESDHKGYIIKTCFMDFDRLRSGTVTRAQFLSCLPFQSVSQREKQLLLRKYSTGDLVNYMLFHDEVEGQLDETTGIRKNFLSTSNTRVRSKHGTDKKNLMTLMANTAKSDVIFFDDSLAEAAENVIRRQLLRHRVRIEDMMRDFDPLNHGCITPNQFKQSIFALKLPRDHLTDEQVEALKGKYLFANRDGKKFVKYRAFLGEMNRVFTEKDLESQPLGTVNVPTELLITDKRILSETSKEKRVQEVLDELRESIHTRRIFIKPVLQDFDKTQKGTYLTRRITRTRFARALATLGLYLSTEDCALLCERYDSDNNRSVNYTMFVDDVDFEEHAYSTGQN